MALNKIFTCEYHSMVNKLILAFSPNIVYPVTEAEYVYRIPCITLRPFQKCVLGITLDCISFWSTNSEGLWSVKYPFNVITPIYNLSRSSRVAYIGQIDLFPNYLY